MDKSCGKGLARFGGLATVASCDSQRIRALIVHAGIPHTSILKSNMHEHVATNAVTINIVTVRDTYM